MAKSMLRKLIYLIILFIIVPVLGFSAYILFLRVASYNTARDEIRTAIAQEYDTLFFIIGDLVNLPTEIGDVQSLRRLSVQYHPLIRLPSEIGNLSNLEEFSIATTRLRELPPEIGNLTNLTWLVLERNRLRELPPEIGNLSNLQTLRLRDNQLTSLPSEIGNLTNLTELQLSGNPFNAPQEIIEQGDWAIFHYYASQN